MLPAAAVRAMLIITSQQAATFKETAGARAMERFT
jgi:hypothetical protein